MTQPLTLPSFAKINWLLKVGGRRADGFHELCTVFQTVDLCDRLTFEESDDLFLECDDPQVPTDGGNLVIKAAKLLLERGGSKRGAHIKLQKVIPAPGGLGGGSSNAAVALLGLSHLWNLGPGLDELMKMAAELGSDVPFFLMGGTAMATGRGEILEPATEVSEALMAIVTPKISVNTGEAFKSLQRESLTYADPESNLALCRRDAQNLQIEQGQLVNDFEGPVFEAFPEVRRVKETLNENGARVAQMSGSGASVYAVFDKEETRQATLKAIAKEDWRMFAAATLSRSQYREALNPCHRLLPISF